MKLFQRIDLLSLISKYSFCLGGENRFYGWTGGKVGTKLENCHFSRDSKENCCNFSLEG